MNRLDKLRKVHKLVGDLLDDFNEVSSASDSSDFKVVSDASDILSRVVATLTAEPQSAGQVAALVGVTPEQARQALARLVRENRAVRVQRGRYVK